MIVVPGEFFNDFMQGLKLIACTGASIFFLTKNKWTYIEGNTLTKWSPCTLNSQVLSNL